MLGYWSACHSLIVCRFYLRKSAGSAGKFLVTQSSTEKSQRSTELRSEGPQTPLWTSV
jgi:hypothetical protein